MIIKICNTIKRNQLIIFNVNWLETRPSLIKIIVSFYAQNALFGLQNSHCMYVLYVL